MGDDYDQEAEPRWNLIEHVREQIEAGTYETHKKLWLVSGRLLDRLREHGSANESEHE